MAGFYPLEGRRRLAIVAASPFRYNSHSADPARIFVFGKWVTDQRLRELSPEGASELRSFWLESAMANPALKKKVVNLLAGSAPGFRSRVPLQGSAPVVFGASGNVLGGLVLLRDAEGLPSACIEVRVPRDL
jgi:hypothetical protein